MEKSNDYSLEIINKNDLNLAITEGEENIKIELIIKNNGTKEWPENAARLVFKDDKNITDKLIVLRPQKPEEEQKYEINMEDLNIYPPWKYEAGINFEINGKQYGNEIDIDITINEKQKNDDDDDKADIIKQFRNTYGLDVQDYPDKILLDKLKKYNFNLPKAFTALFDK